MKTLGKIGFGIGVILLMLAGMAIEGDVRVAFGFASVGMLLVLALNKFMED